MQYLPDIIKLQRLLFEKFHRRLDRNEAEKYTWKAFLKNSKKKLLYCHILACELIIRCRTSVTLNTIGTIDNEVNYHIIFVLIAIDATKFDVLTRLSNGNKLGA